MNQVSYLIFILKTMISSEAEPFKTQRSRYNFTTTPPCAFGIMTYLLISKSTGTVLWNSLFLLIIITMWLLTRQHIVFIPVKLLSFLRENYTALLHQLQEFALSICSTCPLPPICVIIPSCKQYYPRLTVSQGSPILIFMKAVICYLRELETNIFLIRKQPNLSYILFYLTFLLSWFKTILNQLPKKFILNPLNRRNISRNSMMFLRILMPITWKTFVLKTSLLLLALASIIFRAYLSNIQTLPSAIT